MDSSNNEIDKRAFDIKDLLELMKKHWMIIVSLVLVCSLFSLYFSIKAKPVYKASSSLLIERPSRMGSLDQLFGMMGMDWEFYPNQIHLLTSVPVAKRVVEQIGIDKFIPKNIEKKWYEKLIPGSSKADYSNMSEDDLIAIALLNVQNTMTVEQSKGSGVFYITFDDYDPFLATQKANTLVESYIDEVIESGIHAKQRTGENISKSLPELEAKVAKSEKKLKEFQRKNKIFMPEGDEMAVNELTEKNARVTELKRNKLNLKSVYNRIKNVESDPDKLARISALLEKSEVIKQKRLYSETQSNVSELGLVYGPKHPKMKKAMEALRLAQREFYSIIRTTADIYIAEYETIADELQHEKRGINTIKGEISTNNELAFEYDALKNDYEYNKNIYETFLKKSKETDAVKTASVQTVTARVLNKATVPKFPYKPNKKLILLLGFFVGLLLGVGLAFLLEYFDNTYKTSEEIESSLNLPVIGMLPDIDEKKEEFSPSMQFVESPRSAYAESIRTLRTGILLSMSDQKNKTMLVTSTVPSEGKTTIAINLAHSLSHLGTTILVEADLRRPMVNVNLGNNNQNGLSSLISGESSFSESIIIHDKSKALHILPSGVIPANPLELLSSSKFEMLLSKLKENYKFVIIDCAPVMAVSDALVLSQKVDGVLFVIKHESTPSQMVKSAVTRLQRVSAKVLGVALNRLKTSKAKYGKYYRYEGNYYGHYGYNSTKDDGKKRA